MEIKKDTMLEPYTHKSTNAKYETHVEPYLEDIELALKEGWTIESICRKLKVSVGTFRSYQKKYSELNLVVLKGSDKTIKKLEKALIKSATGYKTKKIQKVYDAVGNLIGKKEEEYEIAPNANALTFALCNYSPDKYKRQDKVVEEEGKNTIIIKMPEEFDKWAN